MHPLILHTKLLHSNQKISPVSTNIQPVFTRLLKRRVEWEQGSGGGRCSPIFCGQQETQHVSLPNKLRLPNCQDVRTSFHFSCRKGDLVQTSRRDRQSTSQSEGDSVCKFKSGHTSTAGSTGALVQLSTATAGKVKRGPSFMSSNGRSTQPIPLSEIYDEVYLKWPDQKSGAADWSGDETSFRDWSKSPEWHIRDGVMSSLKGILMLPDSYTFKNR